MHVQSNFYYLVNNQGELIKKRVSCVPMKEMKNTLEIWPEVQKSQACAPFSLPAGEERKGLQFKGRSQGQTSK